MLIAAAAAASGPAAKPKPAPAMVPIVFDPILAVPAPVSFQLRAVIGLKQHAERELSLSSTLGHLRPLRRLAVPRHEVSLFPSQEQRAESSA